MPAGPAAGADPAAGPRQLLSRSLWAWPGIAIGLVAVGGEVAGVGAAIVLTAAAVTVAAAGLARVISAEQRAGALAIVLVIGLATYLGLSATRGTHLRGWLLPTRVAAAGQADLGGRALTQEMLRPLDLRGASLQGATLAGLDLRTKTLAGVDARGASFRHANLAGVNLRGADLRGADLRSACLRGADLSGTKLDGADATGADVHDVVGSRGAGAVGWATRPDGACP